MSRSINAVSRPASRNGKANRRKALLASLLSLLDDTADDSAVDEGADDEGEAETDEGADDEVETLAADVDDTESIASPHPDSDTPQYAKESSAAYIEPGVISIRKPRQGGGGGEYLASPTPKGKGLASVALHDTTFRAWSEPEVGRDGQPVMLANGKPKMLKRKRKLHQHTRGVVNPLLLNRYRTILADDSGQGKETVRFAQIGADGQPIKGTECRLLLSTSAAGSVMLSGDVTAKLAVSDKYASGEVICSGKLYLTGGEFWRTDKAATNRKS